MGVGRMRRAGEVRAKKHPVLCATVAGSLLLSGCVTTGSGGSVGGVPVVDPADSCSIHRQPIAEVQESSFSASNVAAAAAVAVGAGALTGVLSGNWKAGVGVGLGALGATALVGYLESKQQVAKGQADLLAAIDNDAAADTRHVSRVQSAVQSLRNCRIAQYQQLKDDIQAKRVNREDARARFDALNTFRQRDDSLVAQVLGVAEERASLYTEARMKALSTDNPAVALASYEVPASEAQQTRTLKRKTTVRATPTSSGAAVTDMGKGDKVIVGPTEKGWAQVSVDGQTGYVQTAALSSAPGKLSAHALKKEPQVAKMVSVVQETKAAEKQREEQLAQAQDNIRTLLN